MPSGLRKPGEICWFNILTPDPAAAREFLARMLGWSYAEIPGVGHVVEVGGTGVGGLFDVVRPGAPPSQPILGVMLRVESADGTVGLVNELSGRAQSAFDIMQNGRMAVCFDPTGAEFDVWEPKQMFGTEVDSSVVGAANWFELMTPDVERAVAFYGGLLGWSARAVPGSDYVVMALDGRDVAGMKAITPAMGEMRAHWVTYFTVADVDAAMRLAVEMGARVEMEARESHGVRFGGLVSPQGVRFRVVGQTAST